MRGLPLDSVMLRSRISILACVSLLTAAGAGLRLAALGHGLPQRADGDNVIVGQAFGFERLWKGEAHPEERISELYPHLLGTALAALPGDLGARASKDAGAREHLHAASRPELTARRLVALLSILIVPCTYLLGRRFLPPPESLFAAALCATSLMLVVYSRQARPHGVLAAFCVASVLASMWMARSGSVSSLVAAGLCAALALGTLQSGSSVLPALLVAGCHRLRAWRGRGWTRLLIPLACVLLALWLFYPFVFELGPLGRRRFAERPFDASGFAVIARGLLGLDPVLAILAALGLLLGLARGARTRRRWSPGTRRDLSIVCSFALPYFLAIGLFYRTWPRFVMPLVPVLACLAAAGSARLFELACGRLRGSAAYGVLGTALAAAVLALPGYGAARFVWMSSRPETSDLAARWIGDHLDAREDVLLVAYLLGLPLLQDRESLLRSPSYADSPLQRYLRGHTGPAFELPLWHLLPIRRAGADDGDPERYSAGWLRAVIEELGGDYAVVPAPGPTQRRMDDTRAAVIESGGVLVFATDGAPRQPALDHPSRAKALWDFSGLRTSLTASRLGAPIEIYELP